MKAKQSKGACDSSSKRVSWAPLPMLQDDTNSKADQAEVSCTIWHIAFAHAHAIAHAHCLYPCTEAKCHCSGLVFCLQLLHSEYGSVPAGQVNSNGCLASCIIVTWLKFVVVIEPMKGHNLLYREAHPLDGQSRNDVRLN